MPHIVVIDPCYSELEKIKSQMIAEKEKQDDPTRTTYSEVVCKLIREYRKNYNDLTERSGDGDLSPSIALNNDTGGVHPPSPDTSKLFYPLQDRKKIIELSMQFYLAHARELDDVAISVENGQTVVIIEEKFVNEFKIFIGE